MTRLQTLPVSLQKSIQNRSLLKVISGLNNFNAESVSRISKAAGLGGADLLDIACEPELVEIAVEASNIPVCVSSVEPKLSLKLLKQEHQLLRLATLILFIQMGVFSQLKRCFH